MRLSVLTFIGTFYVAALSTVLAAVAGTCTQGDAGRLYGVVFSILLYFIALITMRFSITMQRELLFILPALPVVIWQTIFSARLSFDLLWNEAPACTFLMGPGPAYPPSGGEMFFAVAWPAMALMVILGLAMVWRALPKNPTV